MQHVHNYLYGKNKNIFEDKGFIIMQYIKILTLCFLVFVSGCSSKKAVEKTVQDSPQNLYVQAANSFKQKEYSKAADLFSRVVYEFPYYEGAKKAMVMEVYSYYLNQDYDNVVLTVDSFLKTYPTASEISYMHYMKALSFYEQISIPYRDQTMTIKAKKALEGVVQRFSESKYARDAKIKLDLVEDHLAAHEMIVGRYYLNRGELLASIKRFNVVVKKYSTTSHIEESLYRLFEIYRFMGNNDEARRVAATLGYNYPDSKWYKSAYEIMTPYKKN